MGNMPMHPLHELWMTDKDLAQRQRISTKIMTKHPGCIPFMVYSNCPNVILLKRKFIIDKEHTLAFTVERVIKHIDNQVNTGFNVRVYNSSDHLHLDSTMEALYNKYKSEDGFLYLYFVQ